MDAPSLLLIVALLLAALGGVSLAAPGSVGSWAVVARAGLCALGAATSLWAGAGGGSAGMLATVDGLSRPLLLALFLLGATGWQGAAVGGAALALLAADAPMLVAGTGLAAAAAIAGSPPDWLKRGVAARLVALALLCLVAALLLQGRLDLQFTAMRGQAVEGMRGVLLLASVLGCAGLLAVAVPGALGGLRGVGLLARLLLDLPGPGTPAWWGVPVLVGGAGAAAFAAWRAVTATDLVRTIEQAGLAATALAAAGLGAALLARGADLLPAAALGVGGALFAVLAWGAWGGALHLAARAVAVGVGSTELGRLGGLLPRAPWTALALVAGLASMAAVPFSAGFAALWTVGQAVFAAARAGGVGSVLVTAGAAAALGLAAALLALAAVRVAVGVLLGAPRSAKAARIADPPPVLRAAIVGYAVLVLLAGVLPGPVLLLVQPGIHAIAGAPADGTGFAGLALAPDMPGYVPLLSLGALAVFAAGAAVRGSVTRGGPVWTGGTVDVVARDTVPPAPVLPHRVLGAWRDAGPMLATAALAGALALVVGWAAAR